MSLLAPLPPGAARPALESAPNHAVLANQHLFRQMLDALANPGTVRSTIVHPAVTQDRFGGNQALASLLLTLLDHEVSLHVAPTTSAGLELQDLLVRRTRTSLARATDAAFVVADAATVLPDLIIGLRRGSLAYPDDGATLLLAVESLVLANGLVLELSGPGIEWKREIVLPSEVPTALFDARNQAVSQYPTGIDLLLVDRAGGLMGIPRTTTVVRCQQEGGR